MSELEGLKDDISEIKETMKDVSATVNDMRVLLAGNYLTRTDFEKYKADEKNGRRWWAGFIIATSSLTMAIITFLARYLG
ncbi:MAG: hypothetical protein ACYCVD_03515 [Desulfitobacteriaceae bacterium]